jgi:hypothetical protein
MDQTPNSSINALEELVAIREYVLVAQRQLKSGKMPDMTVLERRTGDLCRIIQQATSDIQQKCAPELKELARQLDDCEQELRAYFTTMELASDPLHD